MNLITNLSEYKAAKLVRCQKHPCRDLYIWNYSELAQHKQHWDDVTRMARALVTNGAGDIIARSFPKFHNIEEGRHTPTAEFVVEEKLDGSLIIAFWHDDEWIVASRGSFVSPQADHARALLDSCNAFGSMDKTLTYSFEVIYTENRIVVNYGCRDEIVLLTAFDKEGREYSGAMIQGISKVATFDFMQYEDIKKLDWENSEGFVVRFSNGERVKIKFQNYLELHRVVTNINAQTVWEMFRKDPSDLNMDVLSTPIPDEFMAWVQHKWNEFRCAYDEIYASAYLACRKYNETPDASRAEFAKQAAKHKYARIIFTMYDNKNDLTDALICEMIKPRDGHLDTPFGGKSTNVVNVATKVQLHKKEEIRTITILIGPSGAGKTTWCRDHLHKNPGAVRVSRDTIRAQLWALSGAEYYAQSDVVLRSREDMVTHVLLATTKAALDAGADVVIDNTHLEKRYLQKYLNAFPYCRFSYVYFDVPLEVCIANDATRPIEERVGEDKIRRQHTKFRAMRKVRLADTPPRAVPDLSLEHNKKDDLPDGYIFDIDGTLADNSDRSPYEWSAVDKDTVIDDIRRILTTLRAAGYSIAICTGRDGIAERKTRKWLADNDIEYDHFYIRPAGNKEPDWVVKEHMWCDIATKMNILGMFDDRDCVVRHGRKCGLRVMQVADGAF